MLTRYGGKSSFFVRLVWTRWFGKREDISVFNSNYGNYDTLAMKCCFSFPTHDHQGSKRRYDLCVLLKSGVCSYCTIVAWTQYMDRKWLENVSRNKTSDAHNALNKETPRDQLHRIGASQDIGTTFWGSITRRKRQVKRTEGWSSDK